MAALTSQVVYVLDYASTNVSRAAYTTLIESTEISCSRLQILDTSGKILKLAIGAAGSEVDFCSVPLSGSIVIPYYIPAGTRIAIEAIDADATTGLNVLSLIP
jgi:hypothetical protein